MARIILFNKPWGVLSQFRADSERTLADYIDVPGVYPAGRLDKDSEGLLLLTDDGALQARISSPKFKLPKTYWVQVEGEVTGAALQALASGVDLNDGPTRPARVRRMDDPGLPVRESPIRVRPSIPTSWIELTISEGRNRQVRRMTASVGNPTLRLFRASVGNWRCEGLAPGEWRSEVVHLPRR